MIDFGVPPIGPLDAAALRPRAERTPPATVRRADFEVVLSEELTGPPARLHTEVEAAGRRWEQLQAQGRELHFERDADTGRYVVHVCDLEGRVLRTVPPSGALEIAGGAPLP